MRIAVTGRNGQVAQSLLERGAAAGITVCTLARPEVDLLKPAAIESALTSLRPDAVVSAAAYTAVDLAEAEPAIAHQINATGAGAVARAAEKLGIPIVHLSTDYVFDGNLNRPYREDDTTGPLGIYGTSKLEGERAVKAATANHAILRTAWVYSPFGKNFARTMLTLAAKRDELSVVSEPIGFPNKRARYRRRRLRCRAKLTKSAEGVGTTGYFSHDRRRRNQLGRIRSSDFCYFERCGRTLCSGSSNSDFGISDSRTPAGEFAA